MSQTVQTGAQGTRTSNFSPPPQKNTQFQNGRQEEVSVRAHVPCHPWILTLLLLSAVVMSTEGVNSQLMGEHQDQSYPIHAHAKRLLPDLPKTE